MLIIDNLIRKGGKIIFFDKYILSGIEAYTIEDLDMLSKKYSYPKFFVDSITNNYNLNQLNIKDNGEDYNKISSLPKEVRLELALVNDNNILKELVYDEEWNVRLRVALNNNEETLSMLMYDPLVEIRASVATNNIIHILTQLMRDYNPMVRYEVAKHYNPHILNVLKYDTHISVRHEALNTIKINK